MPFFDPPPPPPPLPDIPEPTTGRYLPGVVPLELLMAESDRAAVMLEPLLVYPDGVSIRIATYLRERETFGEWHSGGTLGIAHTASAVRVTDDADEDDDAGPDLPAVGFPMRGMFGMDGFRFGVGLPDGTKVTSESMFEAMLNFRGQPTEPPAIGLDVGGGGGNGERYEHNFFLWPVPGPGTVTLVCEWSTHGIPETTVELDAQPMIDASRRRRPIWPEDAGKPSHQSVADTMWDFHKRMRPDDPE